MNPRYPVAIPSKGRAETPLTIREFKRLGVPHTVFVEPQQEDDYRSLADDLTTLHVMPHRDEGPTFTRNYIWDFYEASGTPWFWTFDDNIRGLYRLNYNLKTPVADATIMRCIEDFTERYENIQIAGMNYFMFASRKTVMPPYYLNSRVYSNMLLRGDARYRDGSKIRNVLFFNDDTDLNLRVLKDGWCTVLFNAFLIFKETTMTVAGGMMEFYEKMDNRKETSQMLVDAHPDVAKLTEKWGRWHHHVDYSGFKQQLVRKEGVDPPDRVNNYGMRLEERIDGEWVKAEVDPEGARI